MYSLVPQLKTELSLYHSSKPNFYCMYCTLDSYCHMKTRMSLEDVNKYCSVDYQHQARATYLPGILVYHLDILPVH